MQISKPMVVVLTLAASACGVAGEDDFASSQRALAGQKIQILEPKQGQKFFPKDKVTIKVRVTGIDKKVTMMVTLPNGKMRKKGIRRRRDSNIRQTTFKINRRAPHGTYKLTVASKARDVYDMVTFQVGNAVPAPPDAGVPDIDVQPTCNDGIQNGNEKGIDCGGNCPPCTTAKGCNADGKAMIDALNKYRAKHNKPPIAASSSMCTVAQTHAKDVYNNNPISHPDCNGHSWSNKGPWSSCCYPKDPNSYDCMWDKPRELTSYKGNGYEIAVYGSSIPNADADKLISIWASSSGHNAVMLNQGVWAKYTFKAVGGGRKGRYGAIWFGMDEDPAEK